jgi:hypothetical protein
MLDQNNNNVPPGTASTTGLGGLVALAKAGRISKAQNLFDVEVSWIFFTCMSRYRD